jgi:uncharacterized Tic20 family protein
MEKKLPKKSEKIPLKDPCCFWAMLCHLSALVGFILLPFLGALAFPLLIWVLKKDTSLFVVKNARSVINFVLSLLLYTFIFGVGIVVLFSMAAPTFYFFSNYMGIPQFENYFLTSKGLFLLGNMTLTVFGFVFWFFQWALMIYASIKALNGEVYEYPLTIKFLK